MPKKKKNKKNKQRKILVVEDDRTLNETLAYNLENKGHTVITAMDGLTALEKAREGAPDLVVLDLMLPKLDGFEVCRILRQEMSVPILMLSARADEIDRVMGLEVGADDYLTKPFSMREFLARVKALLRRDRLIREQIEKENDESAGDRLEFGDLIINTERREVRLGDTVIHLKPKEFDLLLYFARNPGIALSRDKLMEHVWGWDFGGGSRTVDVHVRWLRERIEDDPARPRRIITVRSIGYRFVE